jgi:hypothetical protein
MTGDRTHPPACVIIWRRRLQTIADHVTVIVMDIERVRELKQLAAVIEGLCKKLIAEPEYREATFISQTLVGYCRDFDRAYLAVLAGECKAQAQVVALGSVQGPESDATDCFSSSC